MNAVLPRCARCSPARLLTVFAIVGVMLWPMSIKAASYPVTVEFTATGFVADEPDITVPTATVAATFEFTLNDNGLTGSGIEQRDFGLRSAARFEIDGTTYDSSNAGVRATWIDGSLFQILFGSPAAAVDINPVQGSNAFSLVLLGGPPTQAFEFEQMRYTSEAFPSTTFETTSGTARLSSPAE